MSLFLDTAHDKKRTTYEAMRLSKAMLEDSDGPLFQHQHLGHPTRCCGFRCALCGVCHGLLVMHGLVATFSLEHMRAL